MEKLKHEQDKLVTCKCCGSNACYESEFTTKEGKITTWLCMTCGFTTNTTMTENSENLKQTLELTADMIRDLRQDHDGLAWFPIAITMPNKGMIFPEPLGKSKPDELIKDDSGNTYIKKSTDWGWTVVKAIDIPEEEREKYPDPRNPGTFYKKRMDMKSMKRYRKLEFMDAAEELGMFSKEQFNDNKSN